MNKRGILGLTVSIIFCGKELLCIVLFMFCLLLSRSWVDTDSAEWGLWKWCYKKEVYEALRNSADALMKNDISECHDIDPGDSPAYYEVVRFFDVLSIVLFFWSLVSVGMAGYLLSMSTVPALITLLLSEVSPLLTCTVTLGVHGTYYKDDYRWRDANPSLGESFWYIAYVFAFYFPLSSCVFFFYVYTFCCCKKTDSGQDFKPRLPTRHKQAPRTHVKRPANANFISNTSKKKITILRCEQIIGKFRMAMKYLKSRIICCCKRPDSGQGFNVCKPRLPTRHKQAPRTHVKRPANANFILNPSKKKITILRREQIIRKFKMAMKYLNSKTIGESSGNPRCNQSKHLDPVSNSAVMKSLDGPTTDQPGRQKDVHGPLFGHPSVSIDQREDAACHPTDNEDRSSSAWHQQDGQEPSSSHNADMNSLSVQCISQQQHLPTDSHCVIDFPNSIFVFQLKHVEGHMEIVHI